MTAVSIPARPERTVSPLASAGVFVGRSIRHSLRDVEALTMAIVLPVMLMLLFTFVFGGALDREGGYVQYVVPGIILLCAGFGASSTAVDVARDMSDGIVDRFRTMPLRSRGVITGHVVASLLRNLVATGVVIAVALGFALTRHLRARPSRRRGVTVFAIGLCSVALLAVVWLLVRPPVEARGWPTTGSLAQAIGEALLLSPHYVVLPLVVAVPFLVGAVALGLRREARDLVPLVLFLVFAALYAICKALPWPGIRDFITGPWYNDATRLAAMLPAATIEQNGTLYSVVASTAAGSAGTA